MTASLALELRLPLFHERLESLVDVFRRGDEPERHGLHLTGDSDRGVGAAVQRDLRETNRDRRLFREFLGERTDFRRERLVRDGLRHETDRRGFVGGESRTEEYELFCLRLSQDADEPLTAAGSGDEAQVDLRLAELRPTRGEPEIAGEGDLEAAAETVPVDRGDRRLEEVRQVADDLLGPPGQSPHLECLRDVAE